MLYLNNVNRTDSGEYACIVSDAITGSTILTVYTVFEVIGEGMGNRELVLRN